MVPAALAIAVLLLAVEARAQAGGAGKPPARKWVSWQLQEENDFLAPTDGDDEFYTQGLLLTLDRHPDATPKWASKISDKLGKRLFGARELSPTFGIEFGHYIFTPEDLDPTELQTDDRPYAGYLYGGLLLTLTTQDQMAQQIFELQLGFVGPESGAEWVQTRLHELIDSREPRGWDHQLPFEPTLELIYLGRRRFGSSYLDVVPHWGGALGNVQIYANAGFTLRFGRHLSGFPVLLNRATILPLKDDRPDWEFYGFVGAEGRWVGRNLFLDGSTFRDSHSVDREPFVYDLKAGFSLRYRSCRISYTAVRRSQEFDPLPMGRTRGEHDFGSLSFAVDRRF
ncbi:MAG: lipid A deacylase LpxR family protein [Acidobacteriota bacterium]